MNRIQVLDKAIAELIAAGEVVERPASIVKELLENAIDAGATSITVEIKGGGIGYIRVSDNGSGIYAQDIPAAFLRHATSKVRTQADLEAIATLGFRGEALASIAAVAKVELTTRTAQEQEGTCYRIEGGVPVESIPSGCPVGTTLIVRDVFYNTPARMKFLKRDVSEGNAIANTVEKCALSCPAVSFQFVRDGQVRLRTSGNGDLLAVIHTVFGRETAAAMLPVEYRTEEHITVTGYVSSPQAGKSSRIYQNFFINGRYVRTRTASAAVEEAFKNKMMVGKFPACALHIHIQTQDVDVNVHPAKIEVRFAQEKPIFNAVYFAVKTTLSKLPGVLEQEFQPPAAKPQTPINPLTLHLSQEGLSQQRLDISSAPRSAGYSIKEEEHTPQGFSAPMSFSAATNLSAASLAAQKNWTQAVEQSFRADSLTEKYAPARTMAPADAAQTAEQGEYRVIGELFLTYIVLEQADTLLLIDKHAAHERILFDRLLRDIAYGNRQVLLAPQAVTLAMPEYSVLVEHADTVEKLGFCIEDFGSGTVIVREVPIEIPSSDYPGILSEIATRLLEERNQLMPASLEQLYCSIACKSAIRAGDKNAAGELQEIVRILHQNPEITHCPHGRPIRVRMKKSELERMFGRIL